jgi:hypothetical protein
MKVLNTPQTAKLLGISIGRLSRAIWDNRINAPQKGPANAYLWTLKDIEHASWVLLGRGLDQTVRKQLEDASQLEKQR